jgi:hypothetical protein
MAYNTTAIIVDVNGKPCPQYYDPVSDTFLPMSKETVPVPVRTDKGAHRTAVTAIDKCTVITLVTAADSATAGSLTAVAHGIAVSPRNGWGPVGSSNILTVTPTVNKSIDITVPQSTGATHYDIFLSTSTTAPLWVASITEAQRAAGCAVTAVATVGAGGSAGVVNVRVVGTGIASTNTIFTTNNAYRPTTPTPLDCVGKSVAYVLVKLTVTDLRSAPALSVIPFYQGDTSATDFFQGELRAVALLDGVGKTLEQAFILDVDAVSGLVILVDDIAGQGAAATIYVELA